MKGRIKQPRTVRLSRLGKIKIGKISERGFPQSLDHFIARGNYAGFFNQIYGDKPEIIQIVFISDNAAEVCDERFEYRDNAGRLVAYGDGETFHVHDPKTDEYVERAGRETMDAVAKWKPNKTGWQTTLTMRFILPALKGIAGFWELTTKGKRSSINNVRDTFDAINELNGSVKGVLFDLRVEMVKSNKPESRAQFPVISLIPNESPENVEKVNGRSLGFNPESKKLN